MSIRELTKIANKLDSLGLTKEADVLDSYIRKSAAFTPFGEAPGSYDYKPPGDIGSLLVKWLDHVLISNVMVTNSRVGIEKCVEELIKISNFINEQAEGDDASRVGFMTWFDRNVEGTTFSGMAGGYSGAYNVIADEIVELANDIGARIKEFPGGTWDKTPGLDAQINLSGYYAPVCRSLRFVAEKFRNSYKTESKKSEPSSPEAPTSKPLVTMQEGTVYDKTKSTLSGWDKYMAKTQYGAAVKRAWDNFVSIDPPEIGMDKSFSAFKTWYNNRRASDWGGADKSPDQVVRLLALHKKLIESGDFESPIV